MENGFRTVIARIAGDNPVSVRLHERCGFETVGVEREVGHKFGRWLDVVLMQVVGESEGRSATSVPVASPGEGVFGNTANTAAEPSWQHYRAEATRRPSPRSGPSSAG